jgi:hypothetical protein
LLIQILRNLLVVEKNFGHMMSKEKLQVRKVKKDSKVEMLMKRIKE